MTTVAGGAVEEAATTAARRLWPDATVIDAVPLEGGHSGLTFVATLRRAGTPDERLVLKLAPPGRPAVGRHDIARQARLLAALASAPGVKVPPVRFVGEEERVFAMGFVAGEALEPLLDAPGAIRPPPVVEARARGAARLLAAVHAAPTERVARGEEVSSPEGELARWGPTMEAVDPTLRPHAPELARRLRDAVPMRRRRRCCTATTAWATSCARATSRPR